MFRLSYFVFLLAFISCENYPENKLLVTVYYESKCPDSEHFVTKQLLKAVSLLHEYVQLRLVPFGKAHSYRKNHFQCQHGPTECTGNMMQGCTIDVMDRAGFNDIELTDYVFCEMKTRAGTEKNPMCVEAAGIDPKEVDDCFSSGRGTELQLEYETLTNEIKPTFIPTVTINDVFDQQTQNAAMKDLTATLCSRLSYAPQCADYYNTQALSYVVN